MKKYYLRIGKHKIDITKDLEQGLLYLLVIGIPSLCGNIMLRIKQRKWPLMKCRMWYYNLPWEAWADRLGGVKRYYL